jgi:hypothetical protein
MPRLRRARTPASAILLGAQMTNAIVGLIGVIVGGLLTGGTQLFLEWRRERNGHRRAKRLVAGELLHTEVILRSAYQRRQWPPIDDPQAVCPDAAWLENRAVLAGVLSQELWTQLVMVYAGQAFDRARITEYCKANHMEFTEAEAHVLQSIIASITKVRRELGMKDRLAG